MQRSFRRIGNAIGRTRKTLTARSGDRRASTARTLAFEALEPRIVMSAAGLVGVGAQPDGGLSGKITYIHGGHGYTTFHDTAGDPDFWSFQRGNTNGMVEDLGNQEQMTALADYLFRAGATVVPMRPVGHQPLEIVLDNDSPGVTFSGTWSNSSSTVYYAGTTGGTGGPADAIPYRFASTATTETAYARYRPTVVTAGFYPVYSWTRPGTDRATDHLYRVNHSGGITEVTVNHREVGNGLIYLGTYYFEAGTNGYVDISNRSAAAGSVVIADMIRFGNGTGDINRGLGISGRTREDEPALYWHMWHVDRSRGIAASEYSTGGDDEDATVAASPKWAEFMNQGNAAGLPNRVLISFHSNAANGTARGVTVLHNTNSGGATPNQLSMATILGTEIQADLLAQNGQFEHNWGDRGSNITYQTTFNYGELNNAYINSEFDATIIEVAFHDTPADAEMMRDPKVRDAVARSTYQGMVKYFRSVDGNTTPLTMLPGKVTQVRAETTATGSVQVSWTAPAANSYNGDAATGYRIYGSTNGYGFDGGTYVAGGGTTTFTMTGLNPAEGAYFFKVVAVNAGGEGAASEVVAAIPETAPHKVLIVNGFDRLDRAQNPTQSYNGTMDRVRPRFSNSYDYAVQVAAAIEADDATITVDTTSNEFVISGAVNLANYSAVVWILGEESTAGDTLNATEQAKVTAYLAGGGKLLISGTEIGWDLDAQAGGAAFFNNTLKSDYLADDAGTYNVVAPAGSIFTGLSFAFDNGAQFYNADTPDRLTPLGGAVATLNYNSGAGAAGIQYQDAGTGSKLLVFGFPFETITTLANRTAVMGRIIDYFGLSEAPTEIEVVLDNDDGAATYTETGTWETSSAAGYNGLTFRFATAGAAATAQWKFTAPFAGFAEVAVQYRASASRVTSAAYEINTGDGVESATANQTTNGFTWVPLGTYYFQPGERTITLSALQSAGGSVVNADAVRVILTAGPPPDADFNGDNQVDGQDFLTWQRGLGATGASPSQGDATSDGTVDGADLAFWRDQFGAGGAAAASFTAQAVSHALAGAVAAAQPASGDLIALAQAELAGRSSKEPALTAAIRREAPADPSGVRRTAASADATAPAESETAYRSGRRSQLLPHDAAGPGDLAVDDALDQLKDWSWRRGLE